MSSWSLKEDAGLWTLVCEISCEYGTWKQISKLIRQKRLGTAASVRRKLKGKIMDVAKLILLVRMILTKQVI